MALLKNGTISGAGVTASTGYTFPSGSFTNKKPPNMPSDQKAKLLAMHRDGKANAGIYVAVVLVVYFILVIILLCRYGKRRSSRPPDPSSGLDSRAEQGRLQLINFHIGKITSCCGGDGGDCCLGNLSSFCLGRCQRVDGSTSKPVALPAQSEAESGKEVKFGGMETKDIQLRIKEVGEGGNRNNDADKKGTNATNGKADEGTHQQVDEYDPHNEDSDESLEDD